MSVDMTETFHSVSRSEHGTVETLEKHPSLILSSHDSSSSCPEQLHLPHKTRALDPKHIQDNIKVNDTCFLPSPGSYFSPRSSSLVGRAQHRDQHKAQHHHISFRPDINAPALNY